jgi:tRNA-2-methylthio-N6-dimethylallyladenosine synthase
VVLNTCSVREKAEDKLYSRLGEIRQATRAAGTSPTVAVAGCVAQQEGEKLLKRGGAIDVVVGTLARWPSSTISAAARRSPPSWHRRCGRWPSSGVRGCIT